MIEWSTTGKCCRLRDVPKGAQIQTVNGRDCIGICEVCDKPILDGQKYWCDADGVMWHQQCSRTANKERKAGFLVKSQKIAP